MFEILVKHIFVIESKNMLYVSIVPIP